MREFAGYGNNIEDCGHISNRALDGTDCRGNVQVSLGRVLLRYWPTIRAVRTIFLFWYTFWFLQTMTYVNCEGCVDDSIRVLLDAVERMGPS